MKCITLSCMLVAKLAKFGQSLLNPTENGSQYQFVVFTNLHPFI